MFYNTSPSGWLQISLNASKTEFLLIGLKQQLAKIQNCTLNTTHSARNLGFIFDEHPTFSDQISALSKSCYSQIRELRYIRPYLDFKTANTIATSIVHSKLDYCNSLYYNLPYSQLNRLQQIQNCLARAVFKASSVSSSPLSLSMSRVGCSFLFAFHSNYGRICSHFGDIQRQRSSLTLKFGYGVHQGHCKKRRGSIKHVWLSISPPL